MGLISLMVPRVENLREFSKASEFDCMIEYGQYKCINNKTAMPFFNPNSRLIAMADVDQKARRNAREKIQESGYEGAIPICSSMEEMLERHPEIDVVYNATDNLSHLLLGLEAIAAGKHVFLEKPITTTIEGAIALIHAAQIKGVSTGVDHMMTYNAYTRLAIDLARQGKIGELQRVITHMEFLYGTTPDEADSWRVSNEGI